jgi:MipA family protein
VAAGIDTVPKFPGSAHNRTQGIPAINLSYGRFSLGPGDGGPALKFAALDAGGFKVGVEVTRTFRDLRRATDDPLLKGLGDVKAAARTGVFANYEYEWLSINSSVLWDVNGTRQGTLATLGATAEYHPTQAWRLTAGPKLVFGNGEYERTVYGINALQSLDSGRPQYVPKAGLTEAGLDFGAMYQITRHWNVGAAIGLMRLEGDSGKSPIVEKKNQHDAVAFVGYRF